MKDPSRYTNHSGGARGADYEWKVKGGPYGVKTIDWRPEHLTNLTPEGREKMQKDFQKAAMALKRPQIFKGMELAQRNWLPAHHAKAIYAIGYIILPGDEDYKGFVNDTEKEIVAGGTGWIVEMAIQMRKSVYVYDMQFDRWCIWRNDLNRFDAFAEGVSPTLVETFSGVGSRIITPRGISAIEDVYKKTLNHE